jgi:hypothetical protein
MGLWDGVCQGVWTRWRMMEPKLMGRDDMQRDVFRIPGWGWDESINCVKEAFQAD